MKSKPKVNFKPDGEQRTHPRSLDPSFARKSPIRDLKVGDPISARFFVQAKTGLKGQTCYGKIVGLSKRKGGPVEILLEGETEPRTVPFSKVHRDLRGNLEDRPRLEASMTTSDIPSDKPFPEVPVEKPLSGIEDICVLAEKLRDDARAGHPPAKLRAIVREIEAGINGLESVRRDLTTRVLHEKT